MYGYMEASKPKWVNPSDIIGVNSLRLGGLHIWFSIQINFNDFFFCFLKRLYSTWIAEVNTVGLFHINLMLSVTIFIDNHLKSKDKRVNYYDLLLHLLY